ncbi:MAG: DNA-3-methyladenine glycosylase 2 family protein [Epulopiscium sp.]|nr:DNA-3-methyladenine glycosylase 2 family protein [Candidatus Epulonipiscium sp.]
MNYYALGEQVILENPSDFNIEDILECGQCFRYKKITHQHYQIIAHGLKLFIHQEKHRVVFYPTTMDVFQKIWIPYFDLKRNYGQIKTKLSTEDPILAEAIAYKPGIRLLRQDPWECLISFIISQNKRIIHIQQIIGYLSETFGSRMDANEEKGDYIFPTPQQLGKGTEEDIRKCKAGFRAPYIVDACMKINDGEINLDALYEYPTEEARKELLKIRGVGPKIADCVLLFAYGRYEVFPTDVWIERMMKKFYVGDKASKAEIQQYAAKQFGDLGGFAQQYLFYYGREKQINENK